jgi:hypothetical protein
MLPAMPGTAMYMRLAPITIFLALSLGLPAKAQSFSRQDLDCAVAATNARVQKKVPLEITASTKCSFFFFVASMCKMIKPIGQGSFTIAPN